MRTLLYKNDKYYYKTKHWGPPHYRQGMCYIYAPRRGFLSGLFRYKFLIKEEIYCGDVKNAIHRALEAHSKKEEHLRKSKLNIPDYFIECSPEIRELYK